MNNLATNTSKNATYKSISKNSTNAKTSIFPMDDPSPAMTATGRPIPPGGIAKPVGQNAEPNGDKKK